MEDLFKEDKKEFMEKLFKDETQISGFMLDNLSPLTYINDHSLKSFSKFLDCIVGQLGWIEHTCDYDPYLVIELKDNTDFETMNGYYLFDVIDDKIYIEAPGDDEYDIEEYRRFYDKDKPAWVIKIDMIKSISIAR